MRYFMNFFDTSLNFAIFVVVVVVVVVVRTGSYSIECCSKFGDRRVDAT